MIKESIVALVASLAEAGSFWLINSFNPYSYKKFVVAGVILPIIYKATHFEDWQGYELAPIISFQVFILTAAYFLLKGQIEVASIIAGVFLICLTIIVAIAKNF